MTTKQAGSKREEIINRYLSYSKTYSTEEEIISYFQREAEDARKNGFDDLKLFFEGSILWKEKKYDESEKKFEESINKNSTLPYPWNGIGIIKIFKKDYDNAIDAFKKAIKLDSKYQYSWNWLGNAYYRKKDFANAITFFQIAIELDPKDKCPWNGIGNVYCDQKDYSRAIDAYQKAISLDAKCADPWNGLGNVYLKQDEYSKAIEAYQKAIKLDAKYQYSWNGLGYVYGEQKNYPQAIEAYQRAIEIDTKNPSPMYNLGFLYLTLNDIENAEIWFTKAQKQFEVEKNEFFISLTKKHLSRIKDIKKSRKLIESTGPSSLSTDPLMLMLSKTEKFEKEIFSNQKTFETFVATEGKKEQDLTYLKVLRRWNSYTPIIANNFHVSKGGGYFLKIKGKGIVIDPGFNFIDNFKGAGHVFDEIDAVIISHAHNDHTADLESILTLLFTCNKRRKGTDDYTSENTVRADMAKNQCKSIDFFSDEDIEQEFLNNSPRRKKIDLYFSRSVEKKFSGMLELNSNADYQAHVIEKGDIKPLLDGIVNMEVIYSRHHDIISDRDSLGFVLQLDGDLLVYTGDTGWNDTIEKQYEKIQAKNKDKHIILLAHLGGFKDYERNYSLRNEKIPPKKIFYKNHLGRLGITRLIEILKPKVCLVSEFGEELRNHREEFCDILSDLFKGKTLCFPADIGLEYHFDKHQVRAIKNLKSDFPDYKGLTDPEKVKTCLLKKDYSLHYYDSTTIAKESELIQIIRDCFDESSR
jgi:tetratricopeptide (TPR) repeat protein